MANVLSHALASAEQAIQTHESITLDPADFQAFLAALDKPIQPNAALSRAFDRHNEQVERYNRVHDRKINTEAFSCGIDDYNLR